MQKIKEHYVPQFYLNKFTDSNGLLHIYDLKQKKFFTQKPKNICYQKNLYETEWRDANPKLGKYVLNNSIENEFCEYEGEYATLLQKIIDICNPKQNANALILHGNEKEVFFRFIVNLMLRNPLNMQDLDLNEVPENISNSEGMIQFRNILHEMGLGGADSIFIAAQKKAMLTDGIEGSFPQECAKHLKTLDFMFFYAQSGEFITSDIPVCFGDDNTIPDDDKTSLYLALTPKIGVLIGNYNGLQKNRNRMTIIESKYVNEFNSQVVKHHNYINILIGNSRELIEKCVKQGEK